QGILRVPHVLAAACKESPGQETRAQIGRPQDSRRESTHGLTRNQLRTPKPESCERENHSCIAQVEKIRPSPNLDVSWQPYDHPGQRYPPQDGKCRPACAHSVLPTS